MFNLYMKKTISIIFLIGLLYSPNKTDQRIYHNRFITYTFNQLWESILTIESENNHYDKKGNVKVSSKGAIGEAQIMPDTFQFIINNSKAYHLESKDIYNREVNLWAGQWYFYYLYNEVFPYDWKRAVSGYNGGHNNPNVMTKYLNKIQKDLI